MNRVVVLCIRGHHEFRDAWDGNVAIRAGPARVAGSHFLCQVRQKGEQEIIGDVVETGIVALVEPCVAVGR